MKTARIHFPHVLTRRLALLTALTTMVFASAATANAATGAGTGTDVSPDAGWQQFETDGGVGGTSVTGPFHFESAALTKVTVTDAYCRGDVFSVLDNGAVLGDTATVPEELQNCSPRFYLSDIVRADASMLDSAFSHGTFYVGPGSHALEFVNKEIWNGTDAGSKAFFRLETVPLDKTDCKVGGWENFGTLFANQGECVSLSNMLRHRTAANVGAVTFAASPFGTVARGLTPPEPNWHRWTGGTFFGPPTTYGALNTVPLTQPNPGREVLTTTVPVALSATDFQNPAFVTATVTMTALPQFVSFIAVGQYGSLGNTAWELVDDPAIVDKSLTTSWTFRSTAPITPGEEYDPIVISLNAGNSSPLPVVYNFGLPMTAIVSAAADGYATGTGSGWYLPLQ